MMVFQATHRVADALREKDLRFDIMESESSSYIEIKLVGQNAKDINMKLISRDNGNDVAIRVFGIVNVPGEKSDRVLRVLNELNCQYRFIRFTLDGEMDVNAEYDLPVAAENIGYACQEILYRFWNIIDESYPKIMGAIWG